MADDPISQAAKLLGLDEGELRSLQKKKDRDELKEIIREVFDELLGEGGGDDDDADDEPATRNLRDAAAKTKAGEKARPPKPKKADDPDDEPVPAPTSLAARLGLTGS